jgi:hypothetical protein
VDSVFDRAAWPAHRTDGGELDNLGDFAAKGRHSRRQNTPWPSPSSLSYSANASQWPWLYSFNRPPRTKFLIVAASFFAIIAKNS